MTRLHEAGTSRPFSVLDDVQTTFAAYLEAEKNVGRIRAQTDTETLALTLVGTVHHLFMTKGANVPSLRARIQRIVASLISSETPPDLPRG